MIFCIRGMLSAKVACSIYIEMSNVKNFDAAKLKHYNWPGESGQIWRHLTDYELFSKNGGVIDDMLVPVGSYVAKGTLLARPGSDKASLENIIIHFESYSIDFGKSPDDPARGYWVSTQESKTMPTWYKLERPSPVYEKVAGRMETAVESFLRLHDTLRNEDLSLTIVDKLTKRVICKDTIEDYYMKTTEVNHGRELFDLTFVIDNPLFVLDHLKATVDFENSTKFLSSIVKFSRLEGKALYNMFPELKPPKSQDPRSRVRQENRRGITAPGDDTDIVNSAAASEQRTTNTTIVTATNTNASSGLRTTDSNPMQHEVDNSSRTEGGGSLSSSNTNGGHPAVDDKSKGKEELSGAASTSTLSNAGSKRDREGKVITNGIDNNDLDGDKYKSRLSSSSSSSSSGNSSSSSGGGGGGSDSSVGGGVVPIIDPSVDRGGSVSSSNINANGGASSSSSSSSSTGETSTSKAE